MEMINSLPEEEMYPKLDVLLKKYGREAQTSKSEKSNMCSNIFVGL